MVVLQRVSSSRRDIVFTCFHPAKWNRFEERDERNPHARWMACGMDGIGAQGTGIRGPSVNIDIVAKKEVMVGNL